MDYFEIFSPVNSQTSLRVLLSLSTANDGHVVHWRGVQQLLRCYGTGMSKLNEVEGYVDADWPADIDTRRSQTGYIFYLKWRSCLMAIEEADYCYTIYCLNIWHCLLLSRNLCI